MTSTAAKRALLSLLEHTGHLAAVTRAGSAGGLMTPEFGRNSCGPQSPRGQPSYGRPWPWRTGQAVLRPIGYTHDVAPAVQAAGTTGGCLVLVRPATTGRVDREGVGQR